MPQKRIFVTRCPKSWIGKITDSARREKERQIQSGCDQGLPSSSRWRTWLSVGVWLLFLAASWLLETANVSRYICAGAGVALALFVHRFGFRKIAGRNIARILRAEEKRCIFSFMSWKSYLLNSCHDLWRERCCGSPRYPGSIWRFCIQASVLL